MNTLSADWLKTFWALPQVAVNLVVFMNVFGALLLGMLVGYERSYHGRAAGMRTYGIVCMASAALTVFAGYPSYWYGGHVATVAVADPTRLVQGIVTGIGFLGAGVILKEGMNIRGLTTAASIWAASAIGILVGVGFYAAAMLLAVLSSALMMWGPRFERLLPRRPAVAVLLRFRAGFSPQEDRVKSLAHRRGYEVSEESMSITQEGEQASWRFIAVALDRRSAVPIANLAVELSTFEGVERFQLSHVRN